MQAFGVEFSTRFDTGECFDTHNYKTLMAFAPAPAATRTQVPTCRDCRELYALHQYVMSKQTPGGQKIVYDPGTALDYLIAYAFAKSYALQAERGLLSYDMPRGAYRFTFKGAYLTTWGLLQPMKAFRLAALHRRAKKILQEFEHFRDSRPTE